MKCCMLFRTSRPEQYTDALCLYLGRVGLGFGGQKPSALFYICRELQVSFPADSS